MRVAPRHVLLGCTLTITLVATFLAPSTESEVVAPAQKDLSVKVARMAAAASRPDAGQTVLKIVPRAGSDEPETAFTSTRWIQPKRAPVAAAVPVPKSPELSKAPPLPFKALGQFIENGQPAVFLQHNERTIAVRAGEVIDEVYKVESIRDGTMTLTYLPLNQTQSIVYGGFP